MFHTFMLGLTCRNIYICDIYMKCKSPDERHAMECFPFSRIHYIYIYIYILAFMNEQFVERRPPESKACEACLYCTFLRYSFSIRHERAVSVRRREGALGVGI